LTFLVLVIILIFCMHPAAWCVVVDAKLRRAYPTGWACLFVHDVLPLKDCRVCQNVKILPAYSPKGIPGTRKQSLLGGIACVAPLDEQVSQLLLLLVRGRQLF
jgi:hypothetical protein